jgi:hypothetical protein
MGEIETLAEHTQNAIDQAKPVCAEKALARDCARLRVEINRMIAALKELNAERKAAAHACKASKP